MQGISPRQPAGSVLRIGIRLADERERRHVERIVSVAARRSGMALQCTATAPTGADISPAALDLLIVRRGEPGSSELLAHRRTNYRPVAVVYSNNPRESHDWRLDWPARTDDLIRLLDALGTHLAQQAPKEISQP